MSITPAAKTELIQKYATHESDTGSPEVQIAIFNHRVKQLQSHLQNNRHDESARRGLLKLVSKRRRLLGYLRQTSPERYRSIIADLGIRR